MMMLMMITTIMKMNDFYDDDNDDDDKCRNQGPLKDEDPGGYLDRAWCRLELFLCANMPLWGGAFTAGRRGRSALFATDFQFHLSHGRRPHFIFGTKELRGKAMPIIIPHISNCHFEK